MDEQMQNSLLDKNRRPNLNKRPVNRSDDFSWA
jgi:hypothetical protein